MPNFVVHFADPIEQAGMDESRCYYCGSEEDCDLCMETHYHLCLKCRNSNPTQGWWEDRATPTAAPTNAVSDESSFADEDAFHTIGSAVQDTITGADVLEQMILNGSRTKPAKRARSMVSVTNQTALWKDEPKAVQRRAETQRVQNYLQRKKQKDLLTAANIIPMAKIATFFSPTVQDNCPSSSASVTLFTNDEENIDVILDDALAEYHTELIFVWMACINNMRWQRSLCASNYGILRKARRDY